MHRNRKTAVLMVLMLLAVSTWAFGASGDKTKVKGMIIDRTGDSLILKTQDGSKVTVVMDDSSKIQHPRGLGIRKKQVSAAVLIPGLKVSVDGVTNDQGGVLAKTITFDSNDLETAEMIQAGLHPTAEQVAANEQAIDANKQNIAANQKDIAANKQDIAANQQDIAANKQQQIKEMQEVNDRFDQLSQFDVKGDMTIHFKSGSSKISPDDQAQLKQLAQNATKLTGYIIEVKGYADSTGNAAMNTELSQDRAQGVINYLAQQGIPLRHIVAPGAYGETNAVGSNETASGRAENRRVEVKVLVNKGITGS